jgi:hypothetical protein
MKQTYKPKLTINTKKIEEKEVLGNFYSEIDGYSITPRTFKTREFSESADNAIFIEEYGFEENSVFRFGINLHNEEFRKTLNKELIVHNENLKTEILEQSEKITNISGKTNYETFSKHIQLTKCENYILQEAIKYMNIKGQKVILVDTFPRESSQDKITKAPAGRINLAKLDIHAVLLYKVAEDKILAIDPSNSMFSTHLSKHKGIETICSTDERYKIYSPISKDTGLGKKLIDKFKSITGYSKEQYRDCIDIAVKLGLLFNLEETQYKNIDDIMNSQVVKLITNNSKIDGTDYPIDKLIRLKQSSNKEHILSTNKKMKEVSSKITEKLLQYEEEKKQLEIKYLANLDIVEKEKENTILEFQVRYEQDLLGNIEGEY